MRRVTYIRGAGQVTHSRGAGQVTHIGVLRRVTHSGVLRRVTHSRGAGRRLPTVEEQEGGYPRWCTGRRVLPTVVYRQEGATHVRTCGKKRLPTLGHAGRGGYPRGVPAEERDVVYRQRSRDVVYRQGTRVGIYPSCT